jgi:hypothetical protein
VNRFHDGRFAPAACRRSKTGTKRTTLLPTPVNLTC